jgi:protein involved in sex pheromone biosynthesis
MRKKCTGILCRLSQFVAGDVMASMAKNYDVNIRIVDL